MYILSRSYRFLLATMVLAATVSPDVFGQRDPVSKEELSSKAAAILPYCIAVHDVGRLVFGITNFGRVGLGRNRAPNHDCFTNFKAPLGEYPKGSNTTYLYKGAFWVGAVVGRDTLVSAGAEFNNKVQEFHPITGMRYRSNLDPDSYDAIGAVSEQDYIAVYADTFISGVPNPSFDALEGRRHKPLNIEVTQQSYAWSYGHTDDFVLINYDIKNIGNKTLRNAYFGIYWDADVHVGQFSVNISQDPYGGKGVTNGKDDFCGYLYSVPTTVAGCDFRDTLGIAWTSDNDGDPTQARVLQVPNITGIRFLGTAPYQRQVSFNWWTYNYIPTYDFGPQHKKNYRSMGNGTGTPYGDRSKYALLSNGEIDYDQIYARTIGQFDNTWIYPNPRVAGRVCNGSDVQFVLSIGPYDIAPGASASLPVAFVGGEDFHTYYRNFIANIRYHYQPEEYYRTVDFSKFITNAVRAEHVYDIPGVDTDGDEYAGKFHICVLDSEYVDGHWVAADAETTYYQGDGIADWKVSEPPPPPDFWIEPTSQGFRVRFNGERSENTVDIFSREIDFEGYRIYIARDDRETSYSLVAQYDRENYDKWIYTTRKGIPPGWRRFDDPITLEELRCLYGKGANPCADSTFDPFAYSADHPYIHPNYPDSQFYFETHDYNRSRFGIDTPIRRIYPDEPRPPSSSGDIKPDAYTEDGYLKYYEYEFYLDNLLASVPYHIAVTAFDRGSTETGLSPLESSKTLTAQYAYPNNDLDEAPDDVRNVYVYPNPYRDDAHYRVLGLEGRGEEDRTRDRVRKVTFANLPARCTIRILTLDGDLVRKIDHNVDPIDPNSSYHEWDLVTRNIQLVVSGLYYWVVEDDQGRTHIGKLVILL
ncbi:MAG: hypothetical protein ABII79_04290 [bacterium]